MRRNALAYCDFELNTAVKYFKVQATLECSSLQQSVGALKFFEKAFVLKFAISSFLFFLND